MRTSQDRRRRNNAAEPSEADRRPGALHLLTSAATVLAVLGFPAPLAVGAGAGAHARQDAEDAVAGRAHPNVVLIIGDDQAFDDFGFAGHDVVETPRIDGLAAESALFRGYVTAPLCRPSLATLATGLFPHQHRVVGNDPARGVDGARIKARLRELPTVPRLLARAGYSTLQTGKWWEGSHADGGFTDGMTHGDPRRGGRHPSVLSGVLRAPA